MQQRNKQALMPNCKANLTGAGTTISPVAILMLLSLFSFVTFAGNSFADQARVTTDSTAVAPETPDSSDAIKELISKGHRLEQERRWSQAIAHYEKASREHPTHSEFRDRLTLVRAHFNVTRRYGDHRYTNSLKTINVQTALKMYSEVLDKIDTYYVHNPSWGDMAHRGTYAFEVALTDKSFVNHHLANVSTEKVDLFRRQLQKTMLGWKINSQRDTINAAANIAQMANKELGLSPSVVVLEYINGTAGLLDPYSTFLTGAQLEDVFSQIEGNFVGLGIELKAEEDSLLIVDVIPGSPAEKAGIRANDRFIEVDGRTTKEISADAAADLLRGKSGSSVTVVVQRPDGEKKKISVRREKVNVPSVVDIKIIDEEKKIGYFRIDCFQKTSCRDVDAALWQLHRQGMKSLVIDLRGNPGGLLTASVDIADRFLKEGMIVSTRGRSPREDFDYRAHEVGTWGIPMVVLIDKNSASASEIFAGAIHDHHRGQIIGQRSYGKGSVQGIFSLAIGTGGVRLTTAKFYSPGGHAISQRGVIPNVTVHTAAKPVTGGATPLDRDDPVIAAAVTSLGRTTSSERVSSTE